MVNLVWASYYIYGYIMHKSVGVVVGNSYAFYTSLFVIARQLASIHWNVIGTKASAFYCKRGLIKFTSELACVACL